ncbi:hypothetical protein GGF46_000976 [Coemansia sp. RSA 552]|nr:hypothetical protein GGF46_000976 [Coemansia sp. RSA 552]
MSNAVAVLQGSVTGVIRFSHEGPGTTISGNITGLTPGKHGFHIHEFGDITDGCASTGKHFNPFAKDHGAPGDNNHHVGDLGNIEASEDGVALIDIQGARLCLKGKNSIVGRAVVVHADEDDLGQGGHDDSLTTGHAGDRLACGIIALAPLV